MKTCSKCGETKHEDEYYRHTKGRYLYAHCKTCHGVMTQANSSNRDFHGERSRQKVTLSYRAGVLLRGAKRRAEEKQIEFSLDKEWVMERLAAGKCEVTGLEFDLGESTGNTRHPHTPSLDRVDSRLGYTKQNTQAVVWIYNCAKSEWTLEQFMILVKALARPLFQQALDTGKIAIVE